AIPPKCPETGQISRASPYENRLAHAESLELAMQSGALHADKFGRARDIPREPADLGDKVIAFEHFPRLAERQPHDVLAIVAGRHRRHHRADVLRQHVGSDDHFRPAARQNHDSLDIVAELSDVSGPDVGLQYCHRVLAYLAFRYSRSHRNLIHELVDQLWNVL